MAGTIPLTDFITLGQHLYVLMNPQNVDVVIAEIPGFIKCLKVADCTGRERLRVS
jgi:hypothetical protein